MVGLEIIGLYRVRNNWIRYDRGRSDRVKNDQVRNDRARNDSKPFIYMYILMLFQVSVVKKVIKVSLFTYKVCNVIIKFL